MPNWVAFERVRGCNGTKNRKAVLLVQKDQRFDNAAQTVFNIDVFSSVHRNEEELFLFQT